MPPALDAAAGQWAALARRYKDVPSSALSFDLINEPADLHVDLYVKVITRLVETIRAESADRLIIADGLKWGRAAVPEFAGLNIGQSTRGYMPLQVSHYKANWMKGSDTWDVPTWPLILEKETWDKDRLRQEQLPWVRLQQQGVGVHVGEWGAFNHTPHDVVLAWMQDSLDLWKGNGWGWSLWNLYGSFGVLDSNRADVKYEAFQRAPIGQGDAGVASKRLNRSPEQMLLTRRPEELFAAENELDWSDWFEFFSRTREFDGRRKGLVEIPL